MTRHAGWLLVLVSLAGCEWISDPMSFTREEVPRYRAQAEHPAPVANPTTLKVMAWNIKYGACRIDFWFDFWGDRVQLSTTEVNDCLAKVAALVREYDPDILLTEEIEIDSRRSAYVDMVRYLLENTSLRYAAYIETWNSRYIPSEGLGRMNLGNAIFSRYPIVKAERIKQQDRTDLSAIEAPFYIHRAIGRAELDLGNRTVAAYVVHTEAYDNDGTKQAQIQQIYDEVKAETLPFVLGGDFNELPPVCDERADAGTPESCDGKLRLSDFPDEHPSSKGTEFEQPPYTPSVMKKFYDDFTPWIPLARYGVGEANQRPFFTHTVVGPDGADAQGNPGFWTRTLDYLFVRPGETWTNTDVLQDTGRLGVTGDPLRLSDHAPVVGTWGLP
ncbi:MAG: endonuclease/exonuclease/phosphatase family protein [Myxococcota bacterium]